MRDGSAKKLVESSLGKRLTHGLTPELDWSDGVNCRYLGNIMFQEGLDAILQRRGRGGAAGAGALHLQIHIALVETAIDDVAAIVGDRGAAARFEQLQIGRASCRESVCQYVYISVVDVPLKKKS